MIIAIDGNEANQKKRVGIGEYSFQLLTHFKKLKDNKIKYIIYLKESPLSDMPMEDSLWQYKIFGPKKLWTQFALPVNLWLQSEKPDIFFSPTHYSPRFPPCKTAISIMDLSYLRFPEMFRKKDLYQLRFWTKYSLKRATVVFTISEFTKKEIVEYYKISAERVIVTYLGVNCEKYQVSKIKSQKSRLNIKNKFAINGDYILFVGTLQPRKNIIKLIEAFETVIRQTDERKINLVIAGKKGWLFNEIFAKVRELRLEEKVVFTDFVSDHELSDLYRGAICLVNPSFYEGFGLPVVEAFANGCPVVASNSTSLAEIVKDSGILVDPASVVSIADGINKILKNMSLREKLIKKGFERVRLFSWEKCASKTMEMLVKAAYDII